MISTRYIHPFIKMSDSTFIASSVDMAIFSYIKWTYLPHDYGLRYQIIWSLDIFIIKSIYRIDFIQKLILIRIIARYSIFRKSSLVVIYLIVNWELWLVKCDCVSYSAVGHTDNQMLASYCTCFSTAVIWSSTLFLF